MNTPNNFIFITITKPIHPQIQHSQLNGRPSSLILIVIYRRDLIDKLFCVMQLIVGNVEVSQIAEQS